MTPEQWQYHKQWLAVNARPKQVKQWKPKPRKRMAYSQLLERIINLSTPRWEKEKYGGPPKNNPVKPSALKAVPSARLLELSIPKERHRRTKGPIKEDRRIPEEVLKAVGRYSNSS